jgi:hypothetical protein
MNLREPNFAFLRQQRVLTDSGQIRTYAIFVVAVYAVFNQLANPPEQLIPIRSTGFSEHFARYLEILSSERT